MEGFADENSCHVPVTFGQPRSHYRYLCTNIYPRRSYKRADRVATDLSASLYWRRYVRFCDEVSNRIGNFLVLPMALVFGRRPTFLFSSFGLLLSTIGCAVNQNYTGHLVARIIQGLTTGCTESVSPFYCVLLTSKVLPLILADITFIHQRGMIYGWYWATQSMFSAILGLASSYEAIGLSWRYLTLLNFRLIC